jgi:hypothetical protein
MEKYGKIWKNMEKYGKICTFKPNQLQTYLINGTHF